MIRGYAESENPSPTIDLPDEALTLYRKMSLDGVEPDGFTMVSLLTICAELGALALGRRTHVYMVKVGLSENTHAANALLDLYANCQVWKH
ncbi:tetratricopeptide repeat (TPR)-like superfamily protein [Actinidia rufa]|uniref:Tetratricopeptide repeat (TPR)-like superfamily protein n=1 Tax=Actinidia rufa TaxID=165716 RepID=A0A7J0H8Z4_9ERIC|nr:tetratricopeptide repeat (TPR)-like superfamily protein [Actinidia rufa]